MVPSRILLPLALCVSLASCDQATVQQAPYVQAQAIFDDCQAQACTTLNLDSAPLRDYSQLADLTSVTALMISYTDFADLADIATMTQLDELHIGQTDVTDLSGLAAYPDLTLLHAQNLDLTDYSPISGLTQLRELAVGGRTLTDLSFIAGHQNLERLRISNAFNLTDLSALAQLPALTTLHLEDVEGEDLTPLLAIPNLQEVSILTFPTAELDAFADRLRARGVSVNLVEPAIIVC